MLLINEMLCKPRVKKLTLKQLEEGPSQDGQNKITKRDQCAVTALTGRVKVT